MKEFLIVLSVILTFQCIHGSYSPPVNTPNDCPIRCMVPPCPCGAECPKLQCPINCSNWAMDSRGCYNCTCVPNTYEQQCPMIKCVPCPSNKYLKDKNGCQTCDCAPKCPAVKCVTECRFGYVEDSNGCQTCKCRCPLLKCKACKYGFKKDEAGCQTCTCRVTFMDLCPVRRCSAPCPYGYKKDSHGCQTCECSNCLTDNPCKSKADCGNGLVPKPVTGPNGCPDCKCVKIDEKPGTCPRPPSDMNGVCTADCSFDSECPGEQKCCGNCPRKCIAPDMKRTNKPGRCPRKKLTAAIGACVASCEDDSSCPGNQKCCGNCPRECTRPRRLKKPRRGRCPARFFRDRIKPCHEGIKDKCSRDADCEGNKICCGSCPKRCVKSRRGKKKQQ